MVDLQLMRSAIDTGLPRHTRWMVGDTPLDFDFAAERYGLRCLSDADVVGGPLPTEWSGCLVFGRYDYAEGGGASPWRWGARPGERASALPLGVLLVQVAVLLEQDLVEGQPLG